MLGQTIKISPPMRGRWTPWLGVVRVQVRRQCPVVLGGSLKYDAKSPSYLKDWQNTTRLWCRTWIHLAKYKKRS